MAPPWYLLNQLTASDSRESPVGPGVPGPCGTGAKSPPTCTGPGPGPGPMGILVQRLPDDGLRSARAGDRESPAHTETLSDCGVDSRRGPTKRNHEGAAGSSDRAVGPEGSIEHRCAVGAGDTSRAYRERCLHEPRSVSHAYWYCLCPRGSKGGSSCTGSNPWSDDQ